MSVWHGHAHGYGYGEWSGPLSFGGIVTWLMHFMLVGGSSGVLPAGRQVSKAHFRPLKSVVSAKSRGYFEGFRQVLPSGQNLATVTHTDRKTFLSHIAFPMLFSSRDFHVTLLIHPLWSTGRVLAQRRMDWAGLWRRPLMRPPSALLSILMRPTRLRWDLCSGHWGDAVDNFPRRETAGKVVT
jgi:hypothetical protein